MRSRDQGALETPRYYPTAQITQGADRTSAPTRHGHATGRDVSSAPATCFAPREARNQKERDTKTQGYSL